MEEADLEQRQLIKLEEMSLEQRQQAERLYHQLGLEPVVNKVLKEFPKSLAGMDRVTDKIFGPYDVKGRADAVAKITALATYAALSEQYNKRAGDLGARITSVEGERDHIKTDYDNLVAKVADVVGGSYEELKANYNELVTRLSDVEQLGSQAATLTKEKAQLTERYESQITALKDEHEKETSNLKGQLAERDAKVEGLESDKTTLTRELDQLRETSTRDYDLLKIAATTMAEAIPYEEIKKKLGEEMYDFLLEDSKVPDKVIGGVGRFIDFKKYLAVAVEKGAKEAGKHAEKILGKALR